MELKEISAGTKISFEVERSKAITGYVALGSKVLCVDELDNTMIIDIPYLDRQVFHLKKDETLKVIFKYKDIIYSFNATFEDYVKISRIDGVRIRIKSEIEDIQRRENFRINIMLPVKIVRVFKLGVIKVNDNKAQDTTASNISAGGMRIWVDDGFDMGDRVECYFVILGSEMHMQAEVVWKRPNKSNNKFKFEIGIKFDSYTPALKEKIVKFIFDEQRRILRQTKVD